MVSTPHYYSLCNPFYPDNSAKVCAIDAVRGGGPALKKKSLLRDMNKARIAFEGAAQLATGYGRHAW